jgi:hypothetical protein
LIRRAAPQVIHTSNEVFRRLLLAAGFEAKLLPLFSNIPIGGADASWLVETLKSKCDADLDQDRGRFWLFGFFGGMPRAWRCDPLIARIEKIATASGRTAILASLGEAGGETSELFSAWQARFPAIRLIALGPRPAPEVSQFLTTIDFGLTTYPLYMLGKSGSAAAMFEHGVPVIAAWGADASNADPVYAPFRDLVWANDDRLEDRLRSYRRLARKTCSLIDRVTDMFLADLNQA